MFVVIAHSDFNPGLWPFCNPLTVTTSKLVGDDSTPLELGHAIFGLIKFNLTVILLTCAQTLPPSAAEVFHQTPALDLATLTPTVVCRGRWILGRAFLQCSALNTVLLARLTLAQANSFILSRNKDSHDSRPLTGMSPFRSTDTIFATYLATHAMQPLLNSSLIQFLVHVRSCDRLTNVRCIYTKACPHSEI